MTYVLNAVLLMLSVIILLLSFDVGGEVKAPMEVLQFILALSIVVATVNIRKEK